MNNALVSKKQIIALVATLLLLTVSFIAFDILSFRLKSTTPDRLAVATITPYVEFTFSQPIDSVREVTLVTGDSTVELERDINDKTIKTKFEGTLVENAVYNLTLKDVRSKWFDGVIPEVTYTFVPTYRDFNTIPEEQRQELNRPSNSGQINDPFLNNQFPLATDEFYVDVNRYEGEQKLNVEVVILAEVYSPDTGTQAQVSDEKAEELHTKALEFIKKHGGKPENYIISYSNAYLNKKYSDIRQD